MANLNLKTAGLKPLRKSPPNSLLPYLKRWQSNNNKNDLGVVRFIFDLYQLSNQRFPNHRPFLKDFNPEYGVAPWAVDSIVMYFTFEPGMTKEDRCMVCATYREGTKRQPLDAKVLTPTGYKLMGELQVGEDVIGYDGKPTKIEHISETIDRPIYRVETEDGRMTECDSEHLWWVRKMNSVVNKHAIMTLQEMMDLGISHLRTDNRNGKSYRECNFALETVKAVELTEKSFFIEPYMLGLILGDGTISKNTVNLTCHKDDEGFYREQLKEHYSLCKTRYDKRNLNVAYFTIQDITWACRLLKIADTKSRTKFIPESYLYGSIEQRKALLEGLMDTDGNVSGKNNGCSRFASTSERLADGVVSLVRSLGGRATKRHKIYRGCESWNVSILFTDYVPFRLPRKKNKCGVTKHTFSRIISVTPVGNKLGRCIKVANKNGLYITDDFLVTHNTFWHAFAIPLYEGVLGEYGIYFNDVMFPWYDYQLIVLKNQTEAGKRLMTISSTLNREIIHQVFGDYKPTFQEVKKKEAKDTEKMLILSNQMTYQAVGWNVSARGFSMLGGRPDKALLDDPEDKNNTKTPERRADNRAAITEDIFGAITNQGTIFYIGNKIGADDTIGHLLSEKNTQWKKQFHTFTVYKNDGQILPGVGNLAKEVPEWDKRWTIEGIKRRRDWFVKQPTMGGERGWLKEYYNIIKSQADYQIKYHNGRYFRQFGVNWLEFDTPQGKVVKNVYIVIGNDPAISEKKIASDAVVNVTAFTSDKHRFVLEYSRGKFDIHDRYYDEQNRPKIAIKPEEMTLLKRRGSVEETIRMFLKYHADSIVIEVAGQQRTFYNEVKALLNEHFGLYPTILDYTNAMNKTDKLKENPLAYFEAGLYYIRETMVELESEVFSFGSSSKLDGLDGVHLSEQLLYFPPSIKYDPTGLIYNKVTDVPKSDNKVITSREDGLVTLELDPLMLL